MDQGKFSYKRLTSLLLSWCFLALIVTGIVMFINPPGRIANWTDWRFLGLNKEGWHSIHVLMGILFLIGGLFHLFKYNWKVFLSYLRRRASVRQRTAEIVTSLSIFFVILLGSIASVPPFSSVMEFSESIKNSWEPETNFAPVPHMELESLGKAAETLGISEETAIKILEDDGMEVRTTEGSLQEIAAENRTSPQQLFTILQRTAAPGSQTSYSGGAQIPGLGRMTVGEVADHLRLDLDRTLEKLRAEGIDGAADARMRDLATENNLSPHTLLEMIREQQN